MADYEIFSVIYGRPQVAGPIGIVLPDNTVQTFTRSELIALIDAGNIVKNNGYKLRMLDDRRAGVRWITASPDGAATVVLHDQFDYQP